MIFECGHWLLLQFLFFFGTTRGYDTFLDLSCPASIWTFPMVQAVDSFAK